MENSLLSQRLGMIVPIPRSRPSSPSQSSSSSSSTPPQDTADWLEPSEEFPILFGLLTATAQQKNAANNNNKGKPEQFFRRRFPRICPLTSETPSTVEEPDSSIREPGDSSLDTRSNRGLGGGNNSPRTQSQRQNLTHRSGGGGQFLSSNRRNMNSRKNKTNYRVDDDEDAIPTSTTDDFELIPSMMTTNGESYESENEESEGQLFPPRKRSRLEECLMSIKSQNIKIQRQSESYQMRKMNPPKSISSKNYQEVQEGRISTNSDATGDTSIPTLNLRELLAAAEPVNSNCRDVWKSNQFRFEKRKYTRRGGIRVSDPLDISSNMSHNDEARPFQCTQCDLKFKRSYHLTRHRTIHSRDERYFCPGCKTACFQRKDNLLAHMRKCCPPSPPKPQQQQQSFSEVSNGRPMSLLQLQLSGNLPRSNPRFFRGSNDVDIPTPPLLSSSSQSQSVDSSNNKMTYHRHFSRSNNSSQDDSPSPSTNSSDSNSNSWICLSKFMESAGAGESEEVKDTFVKVLSDSEPTTIGIGLGLDLDMVEITEVSPEESMESDTFSSQESFEEFPTFEEEGKMGENISSQSTNISSLPVESKSWESLGQKNKDKNKNVGVNLIIKRENADNVEESHFKDVEEDFPCGNCNAVFRNLNRLLKHSALVHATTLASSSPIPNRKHQIQMDYNY